jgi:hypothetical protein
MLKAKRGRPRLKNPSHFYNLKQWKAHQSAFSHEQSDELGVLKALKKLGVFPLLEYSKKDLIKSVRGVTPSCFGKGLIDSLPKCEKCRNEDAVSEVQGFFTPDGADLGPNSYGIFCACWISSWVRRIGGKSQ